MRDFEKISFEQFKKDVANDINLYSEYKLPQRDSDGTAGYDICLLEDLMIKPGEIKKIPTGIKSFFEKDEVLFLIVRSYSTRRIYCSRNIFKLFNYSKR